MLVEIPNTNKDVVMFNYFTSNADADIRYPLKKYFKWNVVRKMYQQEFEKVKMYYRNREFNYSNNNELVRLVKTLARDPSLNVLEYLSYIDIDAKYIVKQFGFVSNLNKGKVLSNVLFEGYSDEIFLYVDNAVDPISFSTQWKDYASIKVIKTDLTDIYYPTLFRYEKYSPEVSVFEIDVRALMLQYYYWVQERISSDRDTSANVFIPTVVIPNISDSLIDKVIWNRFKALALDIQITDTVTKHPMSLINYTRGIDNILLNIIKDNLNSSIYITQLLRTVPGILADDMYDTLQISKSYYNIQSKWVLWVARLADIVALHKMIGKRGFRINKDLFNKLPYEIKNMERLAQMYSDKLNSYDLTIMRENIKYIKKNIGKR